MCFNRGLDIIRDCTYDYVLVFKFRPLSMCKAALLVANRVNEDILALLVHSFTSKFKIMVHVIACDRGLLRTRNPFITTRGLLQIRADNFIETWVII